MHCERPIRNSRAKRDWMHWRRRSTPTDNDPATVKRRGVPCGTPLRSLRRHSAWRCRQSSSGSRNETSDAPIQKNTAGFRSSAATRAACRRFRTSAARRKRRHGQQTSKSLLYSAGSFRITGAARLFVVVTPYDLDGRIVRHVVGIGSRHAFGNGIPSAAKCSDQ